MDTLYDLDGDKLLDLSISWSDSGGRVELASVRVRTLTGLNGPADGDTNLLAVWRVERLDSTGLVLHETLNNLLHGGANQIEITVADSVGNSTTVTIGFSLPHAVILRTITTGVPVGIGTHVIDATVCADDRRLYALAGRHIVVVDPDSMTLVGAVRDPYAFDDLQSLLCVAGDPILYATDRVERFHRPSMTWLPPIAGSFGAYGIAQSRANPDLLYVGEAESGGIAIIDRVQAVRIGETPIPWTGSPENQEYVFDIAVLNNDSKIYFTRYLDGGVIAADPTSGVIRKHIGVGGPGWPDSGRADAIELSSDEQRLYVAVLDGDPRGVVEISTATDAVTRTLSLFAFVPQVLALSPSERRMFVTTQDRFSYFPSRNVLVDVVNWRVLAEFPRPRPAGQTRFDGGIAFHPNGKLIFVGHNADLDVYLSRE